MNKAREPANRRQSLKRRSKRDVGTSPTNSDWPCLSLDILDLTLDHSGSNVNSMMEFRSWMRTSVRQAFPHEMAICGKATGHAFGFNVDSIIAVDLPRGYLVQVVSNLAIQNPVLAKWMVVQSPVFFRDLTTQDTAIKDSCWFDAFCKYQLRNVVFHGVVEKTSRVLTFFGLYRLPESVNHVPRGALDILASHIHAAMLRIPDPGVSVTTDGLSGELSPGEQEIIYWIRQGKTNWEIAQILGKSEWTVKNQVKSILAKTGARNRTAAASQFSKSDGRKA